MSCLPLSFGKFSRDFFGNKISAKIFVDDIPVLALHDIPVLRDSTVYEYVFPDLPAWSKQDLEDRICTYDTKSCFELRHMYAQNKTYYTKQNLLILLFHLPMFHE
jgi:hypothetical protein